MVRITKDLVRKRAEHNECVIFSLEELSLHQLDIERLEHLDKWCPDLKILYLQSNLIPKIENIGRLKRLQYLNLALNNIKLIENTEGCESLSKLDLTLNFVQQLSSIETLSANYNLKELFLTGNPCTTYEGYRPYVIATLPQLTHLDGLEIKRWERIEALQVYDSLKSKICQQQEEHGAGESSRSRMDGRHPTDGVQMESSDTGKSFWQQLTEHTPETRMRIYEEMKKSKLVRGGEGHPDQCARTKMTDRKLSANDGRALNINEPKVLFTLSEDEGDHVLLDVAVFRYLDTSLLKVELQPTCIQVWIRDKLLQLALSTEISPDRSTVQRSQTTGHLVITMPKVGKVHFLTKQ